MNDEPEYAVGKGRPPEHSRWKSGQSGNPRGRPKSVNAGIPHEKVLGRLVRGTVDGVETTLRADRAFILRVFQVASQDGRVSVVRAVRHAFAQYEASRSRRRRRTIVYACVDANGCVDRALEHLGMATRLDRYRPSCRLLLEPWVVEAALVRRGDNPLNLEEQKRVYSVTRAPHKVAWPEWWDTAACELYRPKIVIPDVAPWTIS